jgi:predicted transcriptional regulator
MINHNRFKYLFKSIYQFHDVVTLTYNNASSRPVQKNNRGKIEIMANMLNIATAPIGKTRMMYSANLSYQQVLFYLKELQKNRLIEVVGEDAVVYRTTEKGREFISYFSKMSELLENC